MLTRSRQGLAGLYNRAAVRKRTWNQPLKKKKPQSSGKVGRKPWRCLESQTHSSRREQMFQGSHPMSLAPIPRWEVPPTV